MGNFIRKVKNCLIICHKISLKSFLSVQKLRCVCINNILSIARAFSFPGMRFLVMKIKFELRGRSFNKIHFEHKGWWGRSSFDGKQLIDGFVFTIFVFVSHVTQSFVSSTTISII